jgi:hypothetical protein
MGLGGRPAGASAQQGGKGKCSEKERDSSGFHARSPDSIGK